MSSEIPKIQEVIEKFLNKNTAWSLLEFLQYREKVDDFTYDKGNEHKLYREALRALPKENIHARECLFNFEVKYILLLDWMI